MSNIEEILKEVRSEQEHNKKRVEVLKKYMADTSAPLEERWAIFEDLSKYNLLDNEVYGDGFIELLSEDLTMYDDFYVERYQTVLYVDMYNGRILDETADPFPQENIDAWREAVLKEGNMSFEFDW